MSTSRGTQLAGPFALVGFVGGAFVGTIAHESWVVYAFAIVTAVVAGGFGAIVTRARNRSAPAPTMGTGAIVLGTLIAGVINGVAIVSGIAVTESPAALPIAILVGMLLGAVFALPFMPALAHVAHADARVGLARPGTHVDRSDRRGVWAVCLGWVGGSMFFGALTRWWSDHMQALNVVAAVVLATILALLVEDVRAWYAVRRAPETDHGVGAIDVVEHPPSGYRAPPSTSIVARDPSEARAEMERAIRRDVLALIAAFAGIALWVLSQAVETTYRRL